MSDDVRNIILGLAASAVSAGFGWFVRTCLWRRRLRRMQRFFGLPAGSECLLVVNRDIKAERETSVGRHDVYALMELAAVVKECGAHAEVLPHDAVQQGFGVRTEFCVGGPASNTRMAAHLRSMLPGVTVDVDAPPGPDQGAFTIGGEIYRKEKGVVEYVLLARLTAGKDAGNDRPVFLACGQRGITNQAAIRYLTRHHAGLARRHGADATFCLLLKVVNSQAYGPDMAELVADVTRTATTAPAKAA
ncbi:hypothetical protein NGB36_28025 [Streptomyces sp. RB6PN25]|uniref:Secreted protein n=1 Tax=Streptomyces humicola TaxID=2953240 RepID=A0ABT1Q364_9ACTN|nr:hypothetical protein [Streptomyces humicola]MCQ4084324.1 hypothetical protein [Streptomyces humicola]